MKINFYPVNNPWDAEIDKNREYALSLKLPFIKKPSKPVARRPPLAVVGGGPSIKNHVEELRNWPGGVWAINGAVQWCLKNGIKASFFTIEREPREEFYWRYAKGVKHAVLATLCRPVLFDLLLSQKAAVEVFDLAQHGGFGSGTSSATAIPMVAWSRGHEAVHLFGCESSWETAQHAYKDETNPVYMLVQIGPQTFNTSPQFVWQAQVLARYVNEFPGLIVDRSGGMLSAMIASGPDYDILKISPGLAAVVTPDTPVQPVNAPVQSVNAA